MRLTVYQRIMRAGESGRGLRLSANDCWGLSRDGAIRAVAMNDDDDARRKPAERERRVKGAGSK